MFTTTLIRIRNAVHPVKSMPATHGQRLVSLRDIQEHVLSVPDARQTPMIWLLSMSHELKQRSPLPLSWFDSPNWSTLFTLVLQDDAAAVLISIPQAAHDSLVRSLGDLTAALATLEVGVVDVIELDGDACSSWRAAGML